MPVFKLWRLDVVPLKVEPEGGCVVAHPLKAFLVGCQADNVATLAFRCQVNSKTPAVIGT